MDDRGKEVLLKEERHGKAKPPLRRLPGISAHKSLNKYDGSVAAGRRAPAAKYRKRERGGKTLIRRETNTPPPAPQSSCTDPKGRKQFQLRVAALLQVLMEMNGGGRRGGSTG